MYELEEEAISVCFHLRAAGLSRGKSRGAPQLRASSPMTPGCPPLVLGKDPGKFAGLAVCSAEKRDGELTRF